MEMRSAQFSSLLRETTMQTELGLHPLQPFNELFSWFLLSAPSCSSQKGITMRLAMPGHQQFEFLEGIEKAVGNEMMRHAQSSRQFRSAC
jgi:hypothetical protein